MSENIGSAMSAKVNHTRPGLSASEHCLSFLEYDLPGQEHQANSLSGDVLNTADGQWTTAPELRAASFGVEFSSREE